MDSTERSVSYWEATTLPLEFAPLATDTTTDVCVIGAGIAGLTTAYLLALEGRRVTVLERATVGGGETGQTTAHLASAMDDYYHVIERMHGPDGARIAYESHQGAIERVAAIVAKEGIDCDFARSDGYLIAAKEEDEELLDRELEAARHAGFHDVERLSRAPLDFWDTGPCLRYPRQGHFHPLQYLRGLVAAAQRLGVAIHTGTEVTEAPTGGSSVRIATRNGPVVTAGAAVVATNYPITRWLGIVPKLAPYRTFVVALRIPGGSVPRDLYWDTDEPYRYVRVASGTTPREDILIVGGEDHKTGQEDDAAERFARLISWTRARFPMAAEPAYRWSGQVQEPADRMAYIGAHPGEENLFVITGDSGQGMTHGTLGAMLVTDLIAGRATEWAKLYDPSRSGLAAPLEMARENLNAFAQFRDHLFRHDVEDAAEIHPGTGAVIRRSGKVIAVYRDQSGNLHERSATCTHLGCVVRWNGEEKSWDCPCHGSRFAPNGEVLTGPAIEPLRRVED